MPSNFEKLHALLCELFQLDQADLDFGIYRIMNQRRDEIVRFLEHDLLPQVQKAFGQYRSADAASVQAKLDEAVGQAQSLGVDPEQSPKVQELRKKLNQSCAEAAALEDEVFSHLYNFFRRYYHEGDFLSLRRYKEGVYAIPYEGEEVKLHWANADQYYVKSSETFRDYTFKLPDGRRVHFKVVEAANDAQREEWVRFCAISEIARDVSSPGYSEPLTFEFLRANPFMMVDTAFFGPEFKERLLASLDDIDAKTDGLLIHSENFQALTLLQRRFRNQVLCTYIDPPYNTGEDGFPYKDSYQHSSWLAMLRDRLTLGRLLERVDGTLTISIDDVELDRLCHLCRDVYGDQELAKLVWDRNRKNDAKFFSVGHEYMIVLARSIAYLNESKRTFREPKEGIVEAREVFQRLRREHKEDWEAIRQGWLKWFEDIPVSDPRRRLLRYSKVGPRGPYRDDGNINWPGGGGPRYDIHHPTTKRLCRKPISGWRYPTPERFWEEYGDGRICFGPDETTVPSVVYYLFESEGQVMPSVFYSYAQTAAQEFDALFGRRVFDNPKNWRDLLRLFRYLASNESWVIDYFAGSGTTAHAVIATNSEDQGKRRYILVEMADYFDSVMIPRIKKVVHSKDWRDGKPVSRDGCSHMFKYLRLESYEDALANLALRRSERQRDLLAGDPDLREQYTLSYMLDVESRGSPSLLNVEAFRNPDQYKLKIERNGETRLVNVDLVETFNWLLGLTVRHIDVIRGVRVVDGTDPEGRRVLVLWRDLDLTDNEALDRWFEKQGYSTRDLEYDLVYVNGDNHLENLRREDQTWKVRLIEEEFQRLMFDVKDA